MSQVQDQSKWTVEHIADTEDVEDDRCVKSETSKQHESVHNESNGRVDECQEEVQFLQTIEADVKDQSYSNILKQGMASPEAMKSQCLYAVQGSDEMIPPMSPQLGN
ncbi:uncharacterized protein LOC119069022 [Bradysia coprophila]|uniref:uncharacterized protein LOC119069022 n=1 Tax=Bradysia coprophila TaxID=38358 RepID=UPI00187D8AC5|nr:uncharacterized protein LOC119069022 [Bradysia coprophila]